MAQIKINRSTSRLEAPTTPNLEAARLDTNLALQMGASLTYAVDLVEKVKAKTKKQEDKNTFRKLRLDLDRDIIGKKAAYENSTDIQDVDNFLKDVNPDQYKELLKSQNKEVQSLISNYLYQEASNEFKNLFTKITSNHLIENVEGDRQDIIALDMQEASNDPVARQQAKDKKDIWKNDPENIKRYNPKVFAKILSDSQIRTKKFQLAFRTENNPMSILDIGKKALEDKEGLTPVEADIVIRNAENAVVADMNFKNLEAEKVEIADTKQKISNYVHIIKRFSNDDAPPNLDNINDLYKLGQINSAQRNSLYKMYTGEVTVSNHNILDYINGAVATSVSVDEIDALRETIILNPEVLARLNVKDAEKFITLFEKYDQDQPGWTAYTSIKKKLQADLGKSVIGNAIWSNQKVDTKSERKFVDAVDMFDQLVLKGIKPEDAYTQTATAFLDKSQLPNIYEVAPIQTISIPNPSEEDFKNPAKFFEDRRTDIANAYKKAKGTISMEQFARDIDSLDTMEDTFLMRQDKFGTVKDAFSSTNTGAGFEPFDPNK